MSEARFQWGGGTGRTASWYGRYRCLGRLREFLGAPLRQGNELWRGHEALNATLNFWRVMVFGAARTTRLRCSSFWTNMPRTSPRT